VKKRRSPRFFAYTRKRGSLKGHNRGQIHTQTHASNNKKCTAAGTHQESCCNLFRPLLKALCCIFSRFAFIILYLFVLLWRLSRLLRFHPRSSSHNFLPFNLIPYNIDAAIKLISSVSFIPHRHKIKSFKR